MNPTIDSVRARDQRILDRLAGGGRRGRVAVGDLGAAERVVRVGPQVIVELVPLLDRDDALDRAQDQPDAGADGDAVRDGTQVRMIAAAGGGRRGDRRGGADEAPALRRGRRRGDARRPAPERSSRPASASPWPAARSRRRGGGGGGARRPPRAAAGRIDPRACRRPSSRCPTSAGSRRRAPGRRRAPCRGGRAPTAASGRRTCR